MSPKGIQANRAKRFAVGYSFPGIIRDWVRAIAILSETFTKERILYEYYHEAMQYQ